MCFQLSKEEDRARGYRSPHHRCSDGFEEIPRVLSSLTYYLPNFTLCHRRDVEIADERWELWSPNSSRVAYFPGTIDHKFLEQVKDYPASRRFDGSLGRFEFTRFPQVFDQNRPWLGFVRRATDTNNKFETVFNNWISKPRFVRIGSIKPDYLKRLRQRCAQLDDDIRVRSNIYNVSSRIWNHRPVEPSRATMALLEGELEYEDAVDRTARISRQIAEKVAWIEMVDLIISSPDLNSVATLRLSNKNVPQANEEFMGLWLNGADEFLGLWFLLVAKLPCFVIHKYFPRRDYPTPGYLNSKDRRCETASKSFFEGTDIDDLNSLNNNEFQQHAVRMRELVVSKQNNGLRYEKELYDPYSSSWEQLLPGSSDPRLLVCSIPIPPNRQPSSSQTPFTTPFIKPPSTTTQLHSTARQHKNPNLFMNKPHAHPPSHSPIEPLSEYKIHSPSVMSTSPPSRPQTSPMPSQPTPSSSRLILPSQPKRPLRDFSHQELDLVTIDKDRFQWVRPPRVIHASNGRWSHWEYVDDEDDPHFDQHGKAPQEFEYKWYDRENNRMLYMDGQLELLPGVLNFETFGAPAPRVNYFSSSGNMTKPSHWVYETKDPSKSTKQLLAEPPKPEDLPHVSQTKPASSSIPTMLYDDDYDYGYSKTESTIVKFPSPIDRPSTTSPQRFLNLLLPKKSLSNNL
jgi:hypothetical protein